jgi:hypothetical protein
MSVAKMRGGVLQVYWSALLTGAVFAIGFVAWLIFNWHLYILGVHVHHFTLAFVALFSGFLSLVITSASFGFTIKAGRNYGLRVNYTAIPMISTIIYFAIVAVLLYSDWSDFVNWASNPAMFNWSA